MGDERDRGALGAVLLALLFAVVASGWAARPLWTAPRTDAEYFSAARSAELAGSESVLGPFLGVTQRTTWRPSLVPVLNLDRGRAGPPPTRLFALGLCGLLAAATACLALRLGARSLGALSAGTLVAAPPALGQLLTSPSGLSQLLAWTAAVGCVALALGGKRARVAALLCGVLALGAGDAGLAVPFWLALLVAFGVGPGGDTQPAAGRARRAVLWALVGAGLWMSRTLWGAPLLAPWPPRLPDIHWALVLLACLGLPSILRAPRPWALAIGLGAVAVSFDRFGPGDAWGSAPGDVGACLGLGLLLAASSGAATRVPTWARASLLAASVVVVVLHGMQARERCAVLADRAGVLAGSYDYARGVLERHPPATLPVFLGSLPSPRGAPRWGVAAAFREPFDAPRPVWSLALLDADAEPRPYSRIPVDHLVWPFDRSSAIAPAFPLVVVGTDAPQAVALDADEDPVVEVWGELLHGRLDVVVYTPQGYAACNVAASPLTARGVAPTGVEMSVHRLRLRAELLGPELLDALREVDSRGERRAAFEVRLVDDERGQTNRIFAASSLRMLEWDAL